MNAPFVSICTPTFNRPELLARTIRSVLSQTHTNLELIITDNSADDASEKVVRAFNDPRIRYERNETNLGFIKNILKSVSLAKGKYIKVLMDDDLIMPQAIELMVDACEKNPSVGVVMAPMSLIDNDDKRIYPHFYIFRKMTYRYRFQVGDGIVPGARILKEFLVHDYPCCVPSGLLYRAECLQKLGTFDPDSGFALDVEIAMRIAAHYDFYYIDQVLTAFRYSGVSLTSSIHSQGSDVAVFYYITRKTLSDPAAMRRFPVEEHPKLIRDSIFFCSCRAFFLNLLAAVRTRRLTILTQTLRLIQREDKYLLNKLRLPLFFIREMWISIFPKKLPPVRE